MHTATLIVFSLALLFYTNFGVTIVPFIIGYCWRIKIRPVQAVVKQQNETLWSRHVFDQ